MSVRHPVKIADKYRRILLGSLSALLIAASPLFVALPAHAVTTFSNDYPDMNAVDCSSTYGQYSWCKGGTWLSSRGYAYRNCTDGAAYWVTKYTGKDVRGWGNATTWDTGASGAGYAVKANTSNAIEPGDIAQRDGTWGHVGFVTAVTKDGGGAVTSITVAELNYDGNGNYRISSQSKGSWDHFIDVNGAGKGLGNETIDGSAQGQVNGVVTRVGLNLYSWTNSSTMSLVSASASSGNWKLSGDRIANLDANGLWVKDGANGWQFWSAPDVQEFQVSPNQVVTRVGSNLYSWTSSSSMSLISSSASQGNWKLVGNRVANLDGNGLWIKDGTGGWNQWASSAVQEYQITPTRAYIRINNNLYVRTSLSGGWTLISASASQGKWKAVDNRVVNLDANGMWVKDGDAGWQQWSAPDVQEFQVSPNQVVTRVGSNLYSWTSSSSMSLVSSSATPGNWKLSGSRLANLDANGLWVKDGSGGWQFWSAPDVQEFQLP